MTRARRGALTLLAALLSLTVLAACGGAPTAESPEEAADTEGTEANTQEVASETAQSGETPTAEETQAAAETVDLGCEDTFPAVYAELDGLEGDERRSRLLELAKEEGELMVYTSNNVVMDLGPVFQEEFGIPTEVYRAPSDQVSQRVHEEADASSILSDIIDNKYLPHVVAWNTELIPAEEVPTSYEDLADPKWKGRVTLEPRHSAMYMALFQHFVEEGRSEDDVRELFRSIGENALGVGIFGSKANV